MYRSLVFATALVSIPVLADSQTITVVPMSTAISHDYQEVVYDFILQYNSTNSELISVHAGEGIFEVAGGDYIPSTSNLPLQVGYNSVGPLPGNPSNPIQSQSYSAMTSAREDHHNIQNSALPVIVIGGGFVIGGAACAGAWFAVRRSMISACTDQGGTWSNLQVADCGIRGTSSIDCDIPEVPPEEPSTSIGWWQFAQTNFPWSFQVQDMIFTLAIPTDH